ncbi:MAG: hypothetical protein R3C53_03760 [Pirellulaceae bacterium]
MDDRQAAELISRSLLGSLSERDQARLGDHLASSPLSQTYALLSAQIEEVVRSSSQLESPDSPGEQQRDERLSEFSKARMRVLLEQSRQQQSDVDMSDRRVAEPPEPYSTDPNAEPPQA